MTSHYRYLTEKMSDNAVVALVNNYIALLLPYIVVFVVLVQLVV